MKLYTNPSQLNQPPGYGRIGAQRVIVSPVERRALDAARAVRQSNFERCHKTLKEGLRAVVGA